MERKIKQAIKNISKNLEVHKEYIRFDSTEQIYIIEDYSNNKIIEIKKDIKFDNLMDYPLKFSYCNFLETVIGRNKTFKEKIIFKEVVFCKVVNFSFSILDKNINFSNVKFEDKLYFEKCQFKEKFEFFGINNLKVEFNNSLFEKEVYFGKEINDKNIEKSNSFGSCSFEYANFSNCYFKNEVYFKNNDFKQVIFRNSKFNDNVYFNNSHFKDYTDFHECEFEKIACFYGVKFYKTPNFSACYFKEPKAVNLINVDIDKLDFKSVEKYIEDNYKDESYKNETKGIQDEKEIFKIQNEYRLRYAKNLKDSFRVIKDVLITQNNTLEAQEWHKLELYAKEKENHINLSVKDREKNADIFKNILIWFNCVLLNVYRNTSDHHNDFLKILNFTVGMIVLYGVFIFFCQACIEPYSKFFNELKSSVIFIIIGILVFLCCIMFYFNRKKSIFAKSIFFIIAMVFIVLYLATYFYKTNEYKTILYLVMCYILSIYICYFFFNIKNIIFNIVFKFMLYLVFLFFLINSSQLINPFTGVFSSDKLYESKFEKRLNDLNTSAIINLASILQNDFNLHLKDQNISFTELNSAKALIIANKEKLKEKLKEILKVYDDKYESDYKKVLNELENNTSNVKNIIEEIDNKNNNSVVSAQLNKFLKLNFSQEIDILYMIKSNFSISEKLSPEQMAFFDQKDSQDKLKSVLALLKFKSSFEGILEVINQDEIIQNTIKSTSVLYNIILLLCIFSLQKTARKNSIVPS
ncbi:pentapeptide repeat-containing protein [Campylobacter jejuni]|uniref:pentapeptide repeat-containing protein n=1 Tax=Campylobacter jejuni TaxID=197 RepID=UPI00087468EC|nr:pentapeptide repeat-containing protein [Campylobacter jejuni]ECO3964075.1 pentapeptide repeat-containing protein [Campylobacter jejuni]OEW54078.1 hypothetical protein AJM78_07985 [Campylobacter jejuni]HDZ4329278.1 pentapeptide repeat-containing protein [Campylobacter jejuni]HEC1717425.1 pentapeptide repeat-containing protein [Campylobacter jejuni]